MPPKPQVFKTPDGKEFSTRAEWRDYMMLTFYSFKNKVDEPQPLLKNPGEVDGQMFDIADCTNSTLVVMDYCEQVQIDEVKNSRIFIGACASSIFIRNCSDCVFYTSCRQLRLRDVVNSTFYIYSMAEVHIETSSNVKFAPFNGGYPEQSRHMTSANLDVSHNLWYDIFDHSDPAKTHANWALLDEADYEAPWFPAGTPCEQAIPRTRPGSVHKMEEPQSSSMQSFSIHQMISDAQSLQVSAPPAPTPAAAPASPLPPLPPTEITKTAPQLYYWHGIKGRNYATLVVAQASGVALNLIEYDGSPEIKAKLPFGQVPYLEDGDVRIGQSLAILRYVAKLGGLLGDTEADFARSEMLIEESNDLFNLLRAGHFAADKATAWAEVFSSSLPKQLAYLEAIIRTDVKYFAGDFAIAAALDMAVALEPTVLSAFPTLSSFYTTLISSPAFVGIKDKHMFFSRA